MSKKLGFKQKAKKTLLTLSKLTLFRCLILTTVIAQHAESKHPVKVLVSHILIKIPDSEAKGETLAAARAKAESVLKAAHSGMDFARLAQQYSEDTATAENGGLLGWVSRGQLAAPLEQAAFGLKRGEISGIVRSDFGFHILLVSEIAEDREQASNRNQELTAAPTPPRQVSNPTTPPTNRWPDPENPKQMAVGRTTEELREECLKASDEELHPLYPNASSTSSKANECAILSITMHPEYESLVDRLVQLQAQLCRMQNGSISEPRDPEGGRVWRAEQDLMTEWEKKWVAFSDELGKAEAAQAKAMQEADADVERQLPNWRNRHLSADEAALKQRVLQAHQARIDECRRETEIARRRALRGLLDFGRVVDKCGAGW